MSEPFFYFMRVTFFNYIVKIIKLKTKHILAKYGKGYYIPSIAKNKMTVTKRNSK